MNEENIQNTVVEVEKDKTILIEDLGDRMGDSNQENVVLNKGERLSCHGNTGNKDIGLEVEGNKGLFGNCDNKECRDNCGTPNNPMVNDLNKEEGGLLNRLSSIQTLNSYALVVKVDEFPKDLEFIPIVISESGI
uniref:Uncharacterized protein n=1 Tax=Tanacetum cinerariifolium TaxID=118510 RepID=A0A699JVA3_TANCI|nr:hypothetical protein [Tanacetum cinerariifolium]